MIQGIRNREVMRLARAAIEPFRRVYDEVGQIYYTRFPSKGVERYRRMQAAAYKRYTRSYEDAKRLCVGNFEEHEKYPYEEYLLKTYRGPKKTALDFACGMGRMINRMLHHFESVIGLDLSAENLEYAQRYLREKGWEETRYRLYATDGVSALVPEREQVDFIYSTIALQHIAVYEIRKRILVDMYNRLKPGGECCLQLGYGWDNGVHWFDNRFVARSTNAGLDVTIPNQAHLEKVKVDLHDLGYAIIGAYIRESPHPGLNGMYHPNWVFIHLRRE